MFTLPRPVIVLALLVVASVTSLPAAPQWIKLKTGDITIYSDARQKDVIEFAVGYVAFRATFRELLVPRGGALPTTILLHRSLSDLQKLLPKSKSEDSQTISFSTEVDGSAFLALAVDGDRRMALRQTYEFDTVWALQRSGFFVPVWMSQGAGKVLSSLYMSKGRCVVGEGPDSLWGWWNDIRPLPWTKFFELSTESKEYTEAGGEFHPQAWALMHWILLEGGQGSRRFAEIAAKLRTGVPLQVVQDAMGVPEAKFTRSIRDHLHGNFAQQAFPFDDTALRASLSTEPAPEVEIRVQRANLLFATRKDYEAGTELTRAQELAPEAAVVKELLARRALAYGDHGRAAELYREAIAAGSTSPAAYLTSAQQRLNEQTSGGNDVAGGGGLDIENAIAEIRQAVKLNPGSTEAYQLLGRAFFVVAKVQPEYADELSRGVGQGAGCDAVRFYRALLYRRLNREDECMADLTFLSKDPTAASAIRRNAQRQLANAEEKAIDAKVQQLVKERRFDEARAAITEASQRATALQPDAFKSMTDWVDENQAWARIYDLRKTGKPEDIRAAANDFLSRYPKSNVAPRVKRILADLDRPARRQKQSPASSASEAP